MTPRSSILHPHHHHLLPPSSTTTRSTTLTRSTSSTTQACAACRYQRRKCAPDCILAPYFPHDRQRQFQNAHKLFGVSNITKIIRDLDPVQKDEAMRTIIYQADVRAHDPVGGCYRIIRELQCQIEFSRAELEIVLHQLAFCRAHAAAHVQQHSQIHNQNDQIHNQNDQIQIQTHDHNQNHDLDQQDQILIDDGTNLYDHGLDLDLGQIGQQQEQEGNEYILGEQNLNEGCEGTTSFQEINSWANVNNSPPPPGSAVCVEGKPAVGECEEEEFKPAILMNEIGAGGERHEFKFEFDEINEPSEETLFNDGNHKALNKQENVTFFTKEDNVSYHQQQHNEDNDLKGAATLFTLTNCSSY